MQETLQFFLEGDDILDGHRIWAMMISGVVVFGSMCEVILPDGEFQKYIRLAIGIMLIFALVSPFAKVLKADVWKIEDEISSKKAYIEREKMEEEQKADVMRIYKSNLSSEIKNKIIGEFGEICKEVNCYVEEEKEGDFGEIIKIEILIDDTDEVNVPERIKKMLKESFDIKPECVDIQRSKGDNG